MDDMEQEQQKQAKQDEASQKTAHVAGKSAATYFGGGLGSKAYDLASKTKVGQAIENTAGKALQRVPGANKAMGGLNKVGALDAADKGLDAVGGNQGEDALKQGSKPVEGISNVPANDTSTDSSNTMGGLNPLSDNKDNSTNNATTEGSGIGTGGFNLKGAATKWLIGGLISFLVPTLIILLVVAALMAPLQMAGDFVKGIIDKVVDFFTEDQHELEEEFYQELKDVQKKYNENYNVCIDTNLITASLMVNRTFDDIINNDQDVDENGEDIENEDGTITTIPYKKMTKQIKLLAKMQIVNNYYELDKSSDNYCSEEEIIKPVDYGEHNSSSPELISKNDYNGAFVKLTSKVSDEQNNAYYIYRPKYKINDDGTKSCSLEYAKSMLPSDKSELSIGNGDDDYTQYVFYWNLINSFIPDYYKDELPDEKDEVARKEAIEDLADQIYMLYQELGPNQTCAVPYAGTSNLCPNGVTIQDKEGNTISMELEEYIAGVVTNEAYVNEGMEALKAQAVAARTYALKYTDYCSKAIPNNTTAQTFNRNINDRARQAVNETAGEILIDKDGNIFSANYDSFCYDDDDCPDAIKNSDGTYTVTYTKVPYGEKHTITLSDSSQYGRIVNGGGHAHGMSQLLSYQLAKEGKNYKEILAFFYSEGVQINLVLTPTNTDGAVALKNSIKDILIESGSSVEAMNDYIFTQVKKAGVGTRYGVIAAANSLISGIYNQTGYKIPYELKPSGKYSGYGIDPNWGTGTGNTTYKSNGLDCSGFISWAMHNGGYKYVVQNAKSWGNTGNKRSWSKGTFDNTAEPGDLIYQEPPAGGNGTSGHIIMIIGKDDSGYTIAEAGGGRGVVIRTISFESPKNYYLVDMSGYYDSATKVSDYPMGG